MKEWNIAIEDARKAREDESRSRDNFSVERAWLQAKHNNCKIIESDCNKKMPAQTFQHDLAMRSFKLIDIGFITCIYFFLGFACAMAYDRVLGTFDEEAHRRKSALRISIELILHIWSIGVLTYFARNLVPMIPFPLDGVMGFQHLSVKEVTLATVFVLVLISFQDNLRAKMKHLMNRLS